MLMVDGNVGNQFRQNAVQNVGHLVGQNTFQNQGIQNVGNQNGLIVILGIANGNHIRCYNCQREDHLACNCTVKPGKQDAAYLQKQMQITLKEDAGIQLTQEEFDFMADAGSYEDIERVNCTLKDNLQQALTSGTLTDKAPIYDSDESAEVSSMEQSRGTVERHPATPEETRALYDSLYNNLATEVEKVNSVNRKLRETNVDLTTELARYKNQEKCFEISQEKYDKLERADESLAKHKALELESERLLRAVVSQDIIKDRTVQAQLGDQKSKSKDTLCVSNTLDPLPQKLENENVELEFQVQNYEKENAHLKTTYKNLFDSIKVTRAQTKAIINSLQDKLHDTIYENAKLRARLFDKVFEQKDTNKVTSNSAPSSRESSVVNNERVIALGIFRINPFKASRVDNFVPNKHVKASVRTKPITVSQPHVVTKEDVNSNRNGFSPNNVESTTRTRRPQPRNNPKSDKVPFKSKSSCLSNKLEKIEENHRSLQSSNNPDHTSSECNNIKLAIRNEKSEVICATCKQCLITANHDECVLQYVNGMKSRKKNQSANVSKSANQKKHKPKVRKPKKVGSKERLASPKPSTPRSCLRWSPTGRMFDLKGKIVATSESVCQSDCSKGDNACTSNPREPICKRFPNSTFSMTSCQNWFDTLLIPLLSEYKSKDKETYEDNECDNCCAFSNGL
ncbi:hypothetical protein Tco_1335642 [Tanacetum coccineum]